MRFAWALVLGFLPHAAGLGDVRPHEQPAAAADARIMRKEYAGRAESPPAQQEREVQAAPKVASRQPEEKMPAGYSSRGKDCAGGHLKASGKPVTLKNAPLAACANQCNKTRGCKGFTYKKKHMTCFFKAEICDETVDNGMVFFQRGEARSPRSAAMLQEIVLEDELERTAGLTPEELRIEALRSEGLPLEVELLEPGAVVPSHAELLRQRAPNSVVALAEGTASDAEGISRNEAEDAEDRRLHPQQAAAAAVAK